MGNCIGKLCRRLVLSQSVTFANGTLTINIPAGSYANGERYCLVIAQAMLHEVQVIIHKQGREIRPQQQAVALPHEDGFYLGEFLNWFLFCFSHSVALCILL